MEDNELPRENVEVYNIEAPMPIALFDLVCTKRFKMIFRYRDTLYGLNTNFDGISFFPIDEPEKEVFLNLGFTLGENVDNVYIEGSDIIVPSRFKKSIYSMENRTLKFVKRTYEEDENEFEFGVKLDGFIIPKGWHITKVKGDKLVMYRTGYCDLYRAVLRKGDPTIYHKGYGVYIDIDDKGREWIVNAGVLTVVYGEKMVSYDVRSSGTPYLYNMMIFEDVIYSVGDDGMYSYKI